MHRRLSASLQRPVTTRGVFARRSGVDLEQRYFPLSQPGSVLSPHNTVQCHENLQCREPLLYFSYSLVSLYCKGCQAFLAQPLCFHDILLKQCDTSKTIQGVGKQFLPAKPSS